jgi:hypothetical protein
MSHLKKNTNRPIIFIQMQCINYIKVWSLFTKLDLGDLINEDEMDSTCSMYGEKKDVRRVLVGKPEAKRPL